MGGLAFAEMRTPSGEPPRVPRMSPEIYEKISAECQAKLETIFERVVIPRDAPAKKDYGDIDFLTGGIKPAEDSTANLWLRIKKLLGAELSLPRGGSHSYGIPHPTISGGYVQVDVELSPGNGTPNAIALFEWTRFMKGDSDLLQIIGISHRLLGITCNDQGLHVRVEQIEPYNKKKALLFLTQDPNKAMEFYGLSTKKYWEGFVGENDLFDWATSGRFFSPSIFERRVEKSNDRSRQAKRPMYSRFVEQYMPLHMDKAGSKVWTREEVLEEAIDMFDKHREYNSMMEEHYTKETEEQLWKDIREVIPAGSNSLTFAAKALRRWVSFQDGKPHIASVPMLEDQPLWSKNVSPDGKEDLLTWVQDHWAEAKALERARAAAAKEAAQTVSSR